MKLYKHLFTAFWVLLASSVSASENADSLFTPYRLNYLPAGSPVWMAQLANPEG